MTSRPKSFLFLALGALTICSCSRGEPARFPVRGQVLLGDRPLAEAMVVFHPKDGQGTRPIAYTDANGRFDLSSRATKDGAEPGHYLVTVELRELVPQGEERVRNGRNLLPGKYADPVRSGLACQVQAGATELQPFRLVP